MKKEKTDKNILVCVTGLTPQIVTETLFCLSVQKQIKIDELFVITTERGVDVLEGKDKHESTPKTSLQDEINEMCALYKISPPKFSTRKNIIVAEEESYELPDILSDKDNILFPNIVAEFIREKTSDDANTLYCSLSGGRKSMSAHFALVLSLFANRDDKLYHIVTSEKFEFGNFYPKTKEEEKALLIAEIPFVKLRTLNSHFSVNDLSYYQIIEKTQEQLDLLNKLTIDISAQKVMYKNEAIKLEPLELALYYKFVERRIEETSNYTIHDITAPKFGKEVKNFLDDYLPNRHLFDSIKYLWWEKGFVPEDFRSKRSKINKKLKDLFKNDSDLDNFKINSIKKYGDTSYHLKALPELFNIILKN